MTGHKVFAVVVTYKRPKILSECLEAVLNLSTYKVSKLHIIVNSNDVETIEIISKFKLEHGHIISYAIYDNSGPAGGFYYGLKKFMASSCDYVWLMDDDIVPKPSCLKALIDCTVKEDYVFSKVLKPDGNQAISFGWWGVLISKEIVEKVGLPIKEFFYWTEDTEYLQNRMIRSYGIIPFRCDKAMVVHLHQRSGTKPSWYFYYTIRNTLYYRSRLFPLNLKGLIRTCHMILGAFYRIAFKEKEKLTKLYYVFLGFYHAGIGKLGKLEHIHKDEC